MFCHLWLNHLMLPWKPQVRWFGSNMIAKWQEAAQQRNPCRQEVLSTTTGNRETPELYCCFWWQRPDYTDTGIYCSLLWTLLSLFPSELNLQHRLPRWSGRVPEQLWMNDTENLFNKNSGNSFHQQQNNREKDLQVFTVLVLVSRFLQSWS